MLNLEQKMDDFLELKKQGFAPRVIVTDKLTAMGSQQGGASWSRTQEAQVFEQSSREFTSAEPTVGEANASSTDY